MARTTLELNDIGHLLKKGTFLLLLAVLGLGICYGQTDGGDFRERLSYGFFLLDENNTEEAEQVFQDCINALSGSLQKREACYRISQQYNTALYFELSISYAAQGLAFQVDNHQFTKELNQSIANNHLDLRNFKLAEDYYQKSVQYETSESLTSNDHNLIGEIERLSGDYVAAISSFHRAIAVSDTIKKKPSRAIYFNNIGLAHLALAAVDSAEYYLNASLDLIDQLALKNEKAAINISFGQLNLKKGLPEAALANYAKTTTFDLSDHPDQIELYQDAYKGMWICYEQLGLHQDALAAYKEYNNYRAKILDYSKQATIFQNQILNERTAHETELKALNAQITLEKKVKTLLLILTAVVLLIVLLLVYSIWLRNKSARQKMELMQNTQHIQQLELDRVKLSNAQLQAEKIRAEQENQIQELERQKLEELLDYKNRELTSTAIHLMNKNEILTEIGNMVSELAPSVDLQPSIERINRAIKENLLLDNDWEVFKKHFTEVHPDFFSSLSKRYTDLTPDELKLCAYLKIQLNSKEIARLINITVVAVNKRRNRVRKKFELDPKDDLHEFLLNF